jgi:hypothetical protein
MQKVKNMNISQCQTLGLIIKLFVGYERNFCLPEDSFHAILLGTILIAKHERNFRKEPFSFSKHPPAVIYSW